MREKPQKYYRDFTTRLIPEQQDSLHCWSSQCPRTSKQEQAGESSVFRSNVYLTGETKRIYQTVAQIRELIGRAVRDEGPKLQGSEEEEKKTDIRNQSRIPNNRRDAAMQTRLLLMVQAACHKGCST